MKKGNRLLAFLLSTMLAAGSVQMPVIAGEAPGEYAEAEAAEEVAGDSAADLTVSDDSVAEASTDAAEVAEESEIAEESDAAEEVAFDEDSIQSMDEIAAEEADAAEMAEAADTAVEDEESFSVEVPAAFNVTLDANGGYFVNEWDDVLCKYIERTQILNKVIQDGGIVSVYPVYEQESNTATFLGWSLERDGEIVWQKREALAGQDPEKDSEVQSQEETVGLHWEETTETLSLEGYAPVDSCVLYAVWGYEDKTGNAVADNDESIIEPAGPESGLDEIASDEKEYAAESGIPEEAPTEMMTGSTSDLISDDLADRAFEENSEEAAAVGDNAAVKVTTDYTDPQEETAEDLVRDDSDDSGKYTDSSASIVYSEAVTDDSDAQENTVVEDDDQENVSSNARMNIVESGECGSDLTWILDLEGILTISGTGWMEDYDDGGSPWNSKRDSIETIIIEYGVKNIGNHAFCRCRNLTNITIPESVTRIGSYGFEDCSSLKSVTIPDSVTSIGNYSHNGSLIRSKVWDSFYGCSSLTCIDVDSGNCEFSSIDGVLFDKMQTTIIFCPAGKSGSYSIPDGVKKIWEHTFRNCRSLTSIRIPDSVTNIGEYAFYGCITLESIILPEEGVTSISTHAFYDCHNLTRISIPNSVTSIGDSAFAYCHSLENILIPSGVKFISKNLFSACRSLTSVIIPDGVTSIGDEAFAGCGMASITIPESVAKIGSKNFYCSNLTDIYYAGSKTQWASIVESSSYLWSKDTFYRVTIHYGNSAEVTLEDKYVLYENKPQDVAVSADVHSEDFAPDAMNMQWSFGAHSGTSVKPGSLSVVGGPTDFIASYFSTYTGAGDYDIKATLYNNENMEKKLAEASAILHILDLHAVETPHVTDNVRKIAVAWTEVEDAEEYELSFTRVRTDETGRESTYNFDPIVTAKTQYTLDTAGVMPGDVFKVVIVPTSHELKGTSATIDDIYVLDDLASCVSELNTAMDDFLTTMKDEAESQKVSESPEKIKEQNISSIASGAKSSKMLATALGTTDVELDAIYRGYSSFIVDHFTEYVKMENVNLKENWTQIESAFIEFVQNNLSHEEETYEINGYSVKVETTGYRDGNTGTIVLKKDGLQKQIVHISSTTESVQQLMTKFSENMQEVMEAALYDALTSVADEIGDKTGIKDWTASKAKSAFNKILTALRNKGFGNILDNIQKMCNIYKAANSVLDILKADSVADANKKAKSCYETLNKIKITTATAEYDTMTAPIKKAFDKVLDKKKALEKALQYMYGGSGSSGGPGDSDWDSGGGTGGGVSGVDDPASDEYKAAHNVANAVVPDIPSITYTGNAQKPVITAAIGSVSLTSGTDYSASYSNNTNAGTATVTINGKGNYNGTITKTFKITPAPISKATVFGLSTKTYTGKAITQTPTVTLGSTTLTRNTDYTVSHKNNINVGTATVTITGKGNYTGTKTATFKINKSAQSITAKSTASSIAVGKTATVSLTGAKGKKSYKSSNTAVATVNASTGKVTAKKVGTVKITATSSTTSNYNAASKTITLKIVPAATSKITAANQAKGIKVAWKKVTGANGYIIYRNSKKVKTIKSGSTVAWTDTAANTNGTKYVYKIVPTASTGNGTAKSLTTYRVAKPAVNSLKNSASKKMTVTWGKNAKATGYQIQYSTSKTFASGNKTAAVTKAGTVSKAIGSLTKGKTYYVRIRTYKTVGSTKYWSAWSAAKSVKISK